MYQTEFGHYSNDEKGESTNPDVSECINEEGWYPNIELPYFLTCDEDEDDDDDNSDNMSSNIGKENEENTTNTADTSTDSSFHNEWIGMLPPMSTKLIPKGCNLHGIDLDDEDSSIRFLKMDL